MQIAVAGTPIAHRHIKCPRDLHERLDNRIFMAIDQLIEIGSCNVRLPGQLAQTDIPQP